jgi:hypothetical protein
MTVIGKLGQEFGQYVLQLTGQLLLSHQRPDSLSEMERSIRDMLLKLGQFLLGAWLAMLEEPYPLETMACRCGAQASYQFKRDGVLYTLLGTVKYRRAYYVCPVCHAGRYPLDDKLGLRPGELSAELESLTAMTGAQLPFAQSSDLFSALTLISVSDESMAKTTRAMGEEVQKQEREWIAQSQDYAWLQEQERPVERPQRLYGALDAVKVHVRGDTEHAWRDLKAGAWFTTTSLPPKTPDEEWEVHATDISYYCDIMEAQQFGDLLWATGCQQRAQLAQELIFLGDGADWIWRLISNHYPEAIQIVDWFHATEYLMPVAQAAFADQTQAEAWNQQMRSELWDGKLDALIGAFERLADHPRAGEAARKAATYFTHNRDRMHYPEYRAKGYQIGSGTIESGCKQVATQRLKVAGAIWNLDNCILTAKARAALLSGQWPTITARREHLSLPLAT